MHGATLTLTDTICLPHDFGHHPIEVDTHSDALTVTTVVGGDKVSLLKGTDSANVSSLFPNGEMRHPWDFPTTY